jgi:hypothetical protein
MIRKAWLAVPCLSGLGAMVAINAGTSTPPPTLGASPEQTTVGKTFSQDTLTKADKWKIAYVGDAVAIEPAMLVTKAPDETRPQPPSPTAPPKIVSRHWHDPNVKKSAAMSHGRRVKGQEPKKSKKVDPGKATVDLRACRRPEGLAGLLRALNLSPGCDT